MKLYVFVNAQKLLMVFYLIWMMYKYDHFSTTAYVYVCIHGCYGYIWYFIKHLSFPNRSFDMNITITYFIGYIFIAWIIIPLIPSFCLSNKEPASSTIIVLSLIIYIFGINIMMCADCQLYYSLKYNKGNLVNIGLNKYMRHPNYLGELLIYLSFAILSRHWISFVIVIGLWLFMWLPMNIQKEKSLSRYKEWKQYKQKSWMYFPNLFQIIKDLS
eukprot:315165_1